MVRGFPVERVGARPRRWAALACASVLTLAGASPAALAAAQPGSASASVRMAIQIAVQVRLPGEEAFHTVTAPGLGSWRISDPGVKDYKYLRQVTNLSAPGSYRALVRFRWLNAHNRLIRTVQRRSPRCEQPAQTPARQPGAAAEQAPAPLSGELAPAPLDAGAGAGA